MMNYWRVLVLVDVMVVLDTVGMVVGRPFLSRFYLYTFLNVINLLDIVVAGIDFGLVVAAVVRPVVLVAFVSNNFQSN